MLNWIGTLPDAHAVLAEPRAHWHHYGKSSRSGRKVGHATLCAADAPKMRDRLARVARALARETQAAPVVEALGDS